MYIYVASLYRELSRPLFIVSTNSPRRRHIVIFVECMSILDITDDDDDVGFDIVAHVLPTRIILRDRSFDESRDLAC